MKYDLRLPVSDRLPGDDAALLAAMGLVRLYKTRQSYPERNNALLRSIVILEHLLLRSKHNYDALLILVRLYMFLGTGSLAMERYSRLSIKNLQHATISWVLYTHISTIHPHSGILPRTNGGGQTTIDPASDMVQALEWHNSASGLCKKSVTSMQENGQWSMSLDALSTSTHIESGFSKLLLLAEIKRIARFLSVSHEIQNLHIGKWFSVVTLDFAFFRLTLPKCQFLLGPRMLGIDQHFQTTKLVASSPLKNPYPHQAQSLIQM